MHDDKAHERRVELAFCVDVVLVEVDARRLEERADEPPGAPAVHLARVALLAVNEPVVLVQSATAHEHREPHPEQHPDEREEQDVDEHGLDGDD